ncbi:MAG: hypothetical protein KZQ95_16960 [Candidatus Thiodiazotropha sp. (ex Epidulcina cf. delphinae)]|nr:hypothetical protein [Candidatus Thiodiazotropha sp. (ex Epidulcina cf. delphinae)]
MNANKRKFVMNGSYAVHALLGKQNLAMLEKHRGMAWDGLFPIRDNLRSFADNQL